MCSSVNGFLAFTFNFGIISSRLFSIVIVMSIVADEGRQFSIEVMHAVLAGAADLLFVIVELIGAALAWIWRIAPESLFG